MNEARRTLVSLLGFDPEREGFEMIQSEEIELVEVAERLAASPVPTPSHDQTTKTVSLALSLMPEGPSPVARALDVEPGAGVGPAARSLLGMGSQVRVLGRRFWVASAALVALGVPLVNRTPGTAPGPSVTYSAFLIAIAPVLAVLGVAYAFRSAGTGMAEVEMLCAISPAQLVFGRLLWVAAYDAALLGLGSLVAASYERDARLDWLVAGWITPMLLLALSVMVLSLYIPLWASVACALAVWVAAIGAEYVRLGRGGHGWWSYEVASSPTSIPLTLAAFAGVILLVWVAAARAPQLVARLAGLPGYSTSEEALVMIPEDVLVATPDPHDEGRVLRHMLRAVADGYWFRLGGVPPARDADEVFQLHIIWAT